jgi:transcriptional regulator with XRE-family HTH domain
MGKANDTGGLSSKAPRMGKARGQVKNTGDPRGQFGAFLRDWIDRKHGGDESRLAATMGVSDRAVRRWMSGDNAPPLSDLDRLAAALGYDDWSKLAVAVVKFSRK